MCGIIGAFNDGKEQKGSVNRFVIDTLQEQIGRGKEGFGIIFIGKDNKIKIERACELTKAMLDLYKTKARMIIMHHRQPTSTDNKLKQTHPIEVINGSLKHKYYFIHNGIISNATDVHKYHKELGFEYSTQYTKEWSNAKPDIKFNDSECLAIELARFIEKQTDTMKAITGSAAFIGIQVDKKTDKALRVFYGRNTSPLKMSGTRGKLRLSSEGQGTEVAEDILYSFTLDKFKLEKKKMAIESSKYSSYEYDDDRGWERNYDYGKYHSASSCRRTGFQADDDKDVPKTEEDLESSLAELTEDSTAIIESSVSDFMEKITDPQELLSMDSETEIRSTTKEIILTLKELYSKACDKAVEASYSSAEEEANKEMKELKEIDDAKEESKTAEPAKLPV